MEFEVTLKSGNVEVCLDTESDSVTVQATLDDIATLRDLLESALMFVEAKFGCKQK